MFHVLLHPAGGDVILDQKLCMSLAGTRWDAQCQGFHTKVAGFTEPCWDHSLAVRYNTVLKAV